MFVKILEEDIFFREHAQTLYFSLQDIKLKFSLLVKTELLLSETPKN